jgi:uncharacterized protein
MLTINNDFLNIVNDILENPKFEELKYIKHHGDCNTVYQHSIKTAYFAYRFSLACGLKREEIISTTRTTLLHDFYDANWRYAKRKKLFEMHAFKHGDVAAKNAKKYFNINANESDAIKNHMFPLTAWPHHKIGWILTLSDKVISTKEMCEACAFYLSNNKQKTKIIKNNRIKIK